MLNCILLTRLQGPGQQGLAGPSRFAAVAAVAASGEDLMPKVAHSVGASMATVEALLHRLGLT